MAWVAWTTTQVPLGHGAAEQEAAEDARSRGQANALTLTRRAICGVTDGDIVPRIPVVPKIGMSLVIAYISL